MHLNMQKRYISKATVIHQGCLSFEPGLPREPKWGHLRDLHKAIKLCEPALVSVDPTVTSLGSNQEVRFKFCDYVHYVPAIFWSGLLTITVIVYRLMYSSQSRYVLHFLPTMIQNTLWRWHLVMDNMNCRLGPSAFSLIARLWFITQQG